MYPELSPETRATKMNIHRLSGSLDKSKRFPPSEQTSGDVHSCPSRNHSRPTMLGNRNACPS